MQASPLQYKFLECILEEDESSSTEQTSSAQTASEQPQIDSPAQHTKTLVPLYDPSAFPKQQQQQHADTGMSTNHSLALDHYRRFPQHLQPILESAESDEEEKYSHDDYNEVWYPSDQSMSCAEDARRSSRTKAAHQFVAYVPHMLVKGSNEGSDAADCWDEEMITVIVDDYSDSEEDADETLFERRRRALRRMQEEEEHEYDADRSDDEGGDLVMGVQVVESHHLLSTFLELAREM